MSSVLPQGATAAEFTLRRYGRPVRIVQRNVFLTPTIKKVLDNNPRRLHWLLQNIGQPAAYLDFTTNVDKTTSIVLGGQGGFLSMDVAEDGESVGWELFGAVVLDSTTLVVIEIISR